MITADMGGNVPPTLAVADALVARGHGVAVAGLPPGGTALPRRELAAATAVAAAVRGEGTASGDLSALLRLMGGRATTAATRALVESERPDVVVADCMLPAPLRGVLDAGAPTAVLFHTFASYWTDRFDRGPAGVALAARRLRPATLWREAGLRLVATDPGLDPGRDGRRLADAVWTGTTETGAERAPHDGPPRILVSLSSTGWPGMLDVYRRIVAALAALPVTAVVTTGRVDLGGEVPAAANVDVRAFADHAELLARTDLLIGHGGHSTTMKALAHGVPVLVLPINPTADQRMLGDALARAGLGRVLRRSARPEVVRDTVEAMLADGGLRSRAEAVGTRMRGMPPGADVAAERIVALAFARR